MYEARAEELLVSALAEHERRPETITLRPDAGNGKPLPDGAKMAMIHWIPKQNEWFPTQLRPVAN